MTSSSRRTCRNPGIVPQEQAGSATGGSAGAPDAAIVEEGGGAGDRRPKSDALMFYWGPFAFKALRSGVGVSGVSAECRCHTTAGDKNECARGLKMSPGFDEAQCILHLKRWLCLGCGLEPDDKVTHMGRQMAPRKFTHSLSAEERRVAIASSTQWSDLERREILSL
jgi:hypothetical protein